MMQITIQAYIKNLKTVQDKFYIFQVYRGKEVQEYCPLSKKSSPASTTTKDKLTFNQKITAIKVSAWKDNPLVQEGKLVRIQGWAMFCTTVNLKTGTVYEIIEMNMPIISAAIPMSKEANLEDKKDREVKDIVDTFENKATKSTEEKDTQAKKKTLEEELDLDDFL